MLNAGAGTKPRALEQFGIPGEEELVRYYLRRRAEYSGEPFQDRVPGWSFYLAFAVYRLTGILQGVYARGLAGNASDTTGVLMGANVQLLAREGRKMVQKVSARRQKDGAEGVLRGGAGSGLRAAHRDLPSTTGKRGRRDEGRGASF